MYTHTYLARSELRPEVGSAWHRRTGGNIEFILRGPTVLALCLMCCYRKYAINVVIISSFRICVVFSLCGPTALLTSFRRGSTRMFLYVSIICEYLHKHVNVCTTLHMHSSVHMGNFQLGSFLIGLVSNWPQL